MFSLFPQWALWLWVCRCVILVLLIRFLCHLDLYFFCPQCCSCLQGFLFNLLDLSFFYYLQFLYSWQFINFQYYLTSYSLVLSHSVLRKRYKTCPSILYARCCYCWCLLVQNHQAVAFRRQVFMKSHSFDTETTLMMGLVIQSFCPWILMWDIIG